MNAEKFDELAWSLGECLQNMIYLVEMDRADEAKRFLPAFGDLRDQALEWGMEVEFFRKNAYVRMPHKDFPGYKPRACRIFGIGGWTVDEHRRRAHFHITVEFILDGTKTDPETGKVFPSHPILMPSDITIESIPVPDLEEFIETPKSEATEYRPADDQSFEQMMKRMFGGIKDLGEDR